MLELEFSIIVVESPMIACTIADRASTFGHSPVYLLGSEESNFVSLKNKVQLVTVKAV